MNYCIKLRNKDYLKHLRVHLQQKFNLIFFLLSWKADLWALLDFLFHAYLLGLRSLIMSSMTKSPGDEDAMQMYLKQMMHSMSLIQSCRADHPAV